MRKTGALVPQRMLVETRADGTLLLTSPLLLGPVANCSGDWLDHWAAETPEAVFLAERDGEGWREIGYAEARTRVRSLAGWLLAQGLRPGDVVAILSGNGVDHGLLALAAQYIGLVSAAVAEQYTLIPGAHDRLGHVLDLVQPRLLFVDDAARYGHGLMLAAAQAVPVLASDPAGAPRAVTAMAEAYAHGDAGVDAARAGVGPDTLAKILFTSGSTSHPKGVPTTHRMLCVNQEQLAACFPLLKQRPHRIVDWLPWNHVFGGSHNFNMMLANGGALYIDDGKPTEALFPRTLENLKMRTGSLSFNVPIGYARVLEALRGDDDLRRDFFDGLDFFFYAGASLPQDIWSGLEAMARDEIGRVLLMVSSWGMTETAPACLLVHEPVSESGIVGTPVPGVTIKLIPEDGDRFELRVKGPNVMTGYYRDEEKTTEAFDSEGYLISGDAVKFADPADPDRGLRFDGRICEDFKLTSGTWVRAANVRNGVLKALDGIAADAVVTGHDRGEVGVLIVPVRPVNGPEGGVVDDPALVAEIRTRLAALAEGATGSSNRVTRALILAEPPSLADHEMTAKGNLNNRKILTRRAALVQRLYSADRSDPAVIIV
ncbi:AMP-binding protein [Pseudooceanicola sp.]|uniref:AMP-binding protein n=1 Tax=Pseudooceanicola sp. TaxID=1914328 RepID=UPI00263125E5|nr:AMP-binding protein [Pseudooceanicola sp.]MDF1855211.1 AMP-binding protein [Pseudooceanicola sp.]